MKGITRNWKTTTAAICGLAAAAFGAAHAMLDGNPDTVPDWDTVVALAVAVGLLFARDSDK